MAISADVLASALQDLAPGYSETFMKWHPVFEKIVFKAHTSSSLWLRRDLARRRKLSTARSL